MSNDKPKTQRVNFSFDDSSLESLRHLQERQLRDGFVELTITNPETNESRTIIVPRQDIQPTGLDSSLSLEARNQVDYFQVAAALERQLTVAEAERDRLKSRTYPHMCQDEHIQIGHADSEHETCPLCREIARNEALQAEVTQLAGETKRLTSDIDTLLESSTLLAEDTEVEEKRLRDCLATAETDRNHAIASIVAVSFSLADAGFKGETVREQVASVIVYIAETLADNPEYDATDGAHPAYWRGHDHATAIFCQHVTEILDGRDDGAGANTEPWRTVRRRLLRLVSERDKWKRRTKLFQAAYKEKDVESFALNLQKLQLEALGTDATLIKQRDSLKAKYLEVCREHNALRQQVREIGEACDSYINDTSWHPQTRITAANIKSIIDLAACAAKLEEAESK